MSSITLAELCSQISTSVPSLGLQLRDSAQATAEVHVDSVTQDSRTVTSGSLFCAMRGARADGHDFLDVASKRGAAAVVVEHGRGPNSLPIPIIEVSSTTAALGPIAALLSGHPSQDLQVVGVTGTNGKTTVVTLVAALANELGSAGASMGTLTGALTTQAAPEFQANMQQHVMSGTKVLAAEVSSHALEQGRVDGTHFAVAVFTNLSQDHLDYHSSMESYFAAKARLFRPELASHAVIDTSEQWGARLANETTLAVTAIDGAAAMRSASPTRSGMRFSWRDRDIDLPLVGRFNVANALLAAETMVVLGYDVDRIAEALTMVPAVPGRFEHIDRGQPFSVVVDYSHTPASLEIAIAAARDLLAATPGVTPGKVLTVFGAAGDRDATKRPLMGQAGARSDVIIVTSDNPRSEDPGQIIDAVIAGMAPAEQSCAYRLPDRREAITSAVGLAEPGDVVLIAGKGHEDYQIVGSERLDFDDRVVAADALHALGWSQT